jgi:hypothetical protein
MDLDFYRGSVSKHGVGATLYHAAYRAANRITRVAVWDALVLTPDRVDESYLRAPSGILGRWVDAKDMAAYASVEESQLTEEGLVRSIARKDRCYGLFEGEELTSYGWYTSKPARLSEVSRSLTLRFDPSYVYLYDAFTLPRYRGRRLHGVGMASALDSMVRAGHRGVLSYVDSSNFASLKSCRRVGCDIFGRVTIVRVGAQFVSHCSPACDAYGFTID